jgi:3-methylcrotonyl-CoA carboxylase alpha subunit/geranyl-CoA carboxylase alpha subunit
MECLDDARFRNGDALISFLDQHAEELRDRLHQKECAAHQRYALAVLYGRGTSALACAFAVPLRLRHRDETATFAVKVVADGIEVAGDNARHICLAPLGDGAVRCSEGGVGAQVRAVSVPATDAPRRWHAQAGGVDWWFDDVSFEPTADGGNAQAATELKAPFNGRVVRIAAETGQKLRAGESAVVIESMKLEHNLAPRAATTVAEVLIAEGQQVTPGQVLLRFDVSTARADAPGDPA